MDLPIISFRAAKFRLTIRPIQPIGLPPQPGSTFRGGFGRVFRRIGCAASALGAIDCPLRERCPYHYIFETPVPSGSQILTKVPTAPHPFVIEPPLHPPPVYEPGSSLTLGLVLIGRAIDYLPYFIYAFEELGRLGLGRGKGRYRLEEVASMGAAGQLTPIYNGSERVLASGFHPVTPDGLFPPPADPSTLLTVHFLTPTCLHYDGRPAGPGEFHVLFRSLLRRISFLNYFHCGGDLLDDARDLIDAACTVETVESRLRWHTWERYSARQAQRVPMGGFTGQVTYRGELAPFWPWLALGEWVHVGKHATFGLGQYRIGEDGLSAVASGTGVADGSGVAL